MGIRFESYTPPAQGVAWLPFHAFGSAGVAGIGRSRLPFKARAAGGEASSAQGAARLPFDTFASAVGGGVGRAQLPLTAWGTASSIETTVTVGALTLPFGARAEAYAHDSAVLRLPFHAYAAGVAGGVGRAKLNLRTYGYSAPPIERQAILVQRQAFGAAMTSAPVVPVTSTFGIDGSSRARSINVITDTLAMSGAFDIVKTQLARLSSGLVLRDIVSVIYRTAVRDVVGASANADASLALGVALIDALSIGGSVEAAQQARALVATTLALMDETLAPHKHVAQDTLRAGGGFDTAVHAYAHALDALRASAVATDSLLLSAVISDTTHFGAAPLTTKQVAQFLRDSAGMSATFMLGEDAYTAWVMNIETQAFSTYENYPFNSFARIGDTYYGAAPDGLYELEGETDNGAEISARMRTGLMSFGTQNVKRVDMAYLGISADGVMALKVITSEAGEKTAYHYKMSPRPGDALSENRVKIGRGLQSVYWQFELENMDGSDFNVADMQVMPMVLTRRIRRP